MLEEEAEPGGVIFAEGKRLRIIFDYLQIKFFQPFHQVGSHLKIDAILFPINDQRRHPFAELGTHIFFQPAGGELRPGRSVRKFAKDQF